VKDRQLLNSIILVTSKKIGFYIVYLCFFSGYLLKYQTYREENATVPLEPKKKPTLLRSLFTVGLMCKHFNFESNELKGDATVSYEFS